MKALTISQPHAYNIAIGEKWVENRTWATTYRGPLAIHAGLGTQYLTKRELVNYPTGCIVATCELVTCWPIAEVPDAAILDELAKAGIEPDAVLQHKHCTGPVAWVLTEIRRCEPVACIGKQGLWEVPAELLADAVERMAY